MTSPSSIASGSDFLVTTFLVFPVLWHRGVILRLCSLNTEADRVQTQVEAHYWKVMTTALGSKNCNFITSPFIARFYILHFSKVNCSCFNSNILWGRVRQYFRVWTVLSLFYTRRNFPHGIKVSQRCRYEAAAHSVY